MVYSVKLARYFWFSRAVGTEESPRPQCGPYLILILFVHNVDSGISINTGKLPSVSLDNVLVPTVGLF